ncbi:putative ATP-grasp superfamily ATP-dependent carboligase [Arthrobacter pigmenti]|uniref:Putative ATP-grasp superfamily ATP-dependent carboligase n=1 Tax=Arthrobacter pigmenti TaxID=271432 RepID=A0A846RV47_9MICC|nr:putative ATP-grasp superfamily ATP-dependent carboligase [Arthrobacter pigmenti]
MNAQPRISEELDIPPRALIVSTARDRGALAAARSLRQDGWVVGVGTPEGKGMLCTSRAVSFSHVVPRPRGDAAEFVKGVQRAVQAGGYDVVFGGGDDWMAALATYRDHIPTPVAHPSAEAVQRALDKVTLAESAAHVGLAAPLTIPATPDAIADWEGPVVVKSRAHWCPGQTRPHRIEARLFDSIASAKERINHMEQLGAEPLLQEPIRGRLGAMIGLFRNGKLEGRVQQSTPRLWPTPNGASARAETVAVDPVLARKVDALLSHIGWWGLVELQFLTDDDGVPHLIDFNGRFFGSIALTNAARPGLANAWGRLVLGESVPSLADAPAGVRYVWAAGDLRRARVERRGGLLADVVDTMRWASRAHHSVWDVRDPGPTWHLVTSRFGKPE